jgi:hypothetical protein
MVASYVTPLVKLLAFTSVYFFESRLFNGLRPIQIKKSGLFDPRLYSRRPAGADGSKCVWFPHYCRVSAAELGELKNHGTDFSFQEGFVDLITCGRSRRSPIPGFTSRTCLCANVLLACASELPPLFGGVQRVGSEAPGFPAPRPDRVLLTGVALLVSAANCDATCRSAASERRQSAGRSLNDRTSPKLIFAA